MRSQETSGEEILKDVMQLWSAHEVCSSLALGISKVINGYTIGIFPEPVVNLPGAY